MSVTNHHVLQEKRKTKRPFVLMAIVLAMFMSAIEGTIVATALPGIVSELGGFSLYSWVFSAYLIMQAVTILIYGKLSDLFGRKPVFIFGIVTFLIGSLLCGFATSMFMLIIFRLVQGLGAGAVTPIATTLVGDLYSLEERAKIQGYLSSVWGVSAILGPLLGGILVQYVSWAWIFWINLPIGIVTLASLILFLHEDIEKKEHQIDYVGSGLFLIAILAFMVVLIQGGSAWKWFSPQVLGLLGVALLFFVLFVWQEARFSEPMMPLSLWKHRVMVLANLATLSSGMIIIGVSSFLPTFVQGVMKQSPIIAGFTLTAMSIGWPVAATIAGRTIVKYGFRPIAMIGGVTLVFGALLFVLLTPQLGPLWAGTASFFVGVGMGLTSTTFIVAIQQSVGWKTRGIATANNMFMRILGSAIGAAFLGGILNSQMKRFFMQHGEPNTGDVSIDIVTDLLNDPEMDGRSATMRSLLENGLIFGLNSVYIALFVIALMTLLFIVFFPKRVEEGSVEKGDEG